jgi:hypothetical protein
MLSAAQPKHLYRFVANGLDEAAEMLRLRCAPLSMTVSAINYALVTPK